MPSMIATCGPKSRTAKGLHQQASGACLTGRALQLLEQAITNSAAMVRHAADVRNTRRLRGRHDGILLRVSAHVMSWKKMCASRVTLLLQD